MTGPRRPLPADGKRRSPTSERPRIAILGAGALGTTMGRALRRSGWPVVSVCRRDRNRARVAARAVGGGARGLTDPARAARGCDLVILTVRDGEIAGLAGELAAARSRVLGPGALALHCSGAVTADALLPLRADGVRTAALHPLQTFAGAGGSPLDVALFEGTWWFHEGDAFADCRSLVRRLGGTMRRIDPSAKALYHAAAVASSNYLVTVQELAVRMATAAGIPGKDALRALLPLIRGTVANLDRRGLPAALTGPVARGDAATVRLHREALHALDPALDDLYAALGRHALRVARERGLDAADARRTAVALRERR